MRIQPFLLAFMAFAGTILQAGPAITVPTEGTKLRGQVEIQGTVGTGSAVSAELSFAYLGDPTGTWFHLRSLSAGTETGPLFVWDTTQLTDGDYRLRLRVSAADGSVQDIFVENLQVRNDEAPLVPTAIPTVLTATQIPEGEVVDATPNADIPQVAPPTLIPRVTMPPNPAEIAPAAVFSILWRSAVLALVLVAALGLLLRLRR